MKNMALIKTKITNILVYTITYYPRFHYYETNIFSLIKHVNGYRNVYVIKLGVYAIKGIKGVFGWAFTCFCF
jgi:hypothetical protein